MERENIPQIVGKAYVYLDGEQIGTRTIFYGEAEESFKQQSFMMSWKDILQSLLGMKRYG